MYCAATNHQVAGWGKVVLTAGLLLTGCLLDSSDLDAGPSPDGAATGMNGAPSETHDAGTTPPDAGADTMQHEAGAGDSGQDGAVAEDAHVSEASMDAGDAETGDAGDGQAASDADMDAEPDEDASMDASMDAEPDEDAAMDASMDAEAGDADAGDDAQTTDDAAEPDASNGPTCADIDCPYSESCTLVEGQPKCLCGPRSYHAPGAALGCAPNTECFSWGCVGIYVQLENGGIDCSDIQCAADTSCTTWIDSRGRTYPACAFSALSLDADCGSFTCTEGSVCCGRDYGGGPGSACVEPEGYCYP